MVDLSLAEATVLAVLDEEPAHGFAVARLTGPDGPLGRVWQVPRPVVYRALGRLETLGLARPVAQLPGRGPRRQLVAATAAGSAEIRRWLAEPVQHVRDVRSHLLVKLALLDRRGLDPRDLLDRQRAVLAPIVAALDDRDAAVPDPGSGFDATLATWRRVNATAVLAFLDEVAAGCASGSGTGPGSGSGSGSTSRLAEPG